MTETPTPEIIVGEIDKSARETIRIALSAYEGTPTVSNCVRTNRRKSSSLSDAPDRLMAHRCAPTGPSREMMLAISSKLVEMTSRSIAGIRL